LFEPDRFVVRQDGYTKAVVVLASVPGQVVVRDQGLKEIWRVSIKRNVLRVEHGSEVIEYEALQATPPELDLSPLPLGQPENVSPERIRGIERELLRRRDLDQTVRKDASQAGRWKTVDADNFAYLKALVQEVGWIDCDRFGKAASSAAILLGKHSSDPRLMQAILPLVEKDVKSSAISAELFSVLYDGLQLSLGKKQRYGTQLGEDEKGPFAVPLEEPGKVDDLRRAIGLPPLAEYLATAGKYLYSGREVRVLTED